MQSVKFQRIRRLAAFTALLSFLLVALGGYVRGTGAGLSCPDWPLCFGRVVPPSMANGVAQEYAHRVLAGLVALCTAAIAVMSFRLRNEYPWLWRAGIFLAVLVLLQAVMGGLTVLMTLNPFIVTGHLVLGTIFLQSMSLVALARPGQSTATADQGAGASLRLSLLLLIAALVAQITLGGFVGSSGASLACPDFPLCGGELVPQDLNGPRLFILIHGYLGFSIGLLSLLVVFLALRDPAARRRRGHLFGVTALVFMQILLGIGNVHMRIPVAMAVLHLAMAQLILLGILTLYRNLPRMDRASGVITPRRVGLLADEPERSLASTQ